MRTKWKCDYSWDTQSAWCFETLKPGDLIEIITHDGFEGAFKHSDVCGVDCGDDENCILYFEPEAKFIGMVVGHNTWIINGGSIGVSKQLACYELEVAIAEGFYWIPLSDCEVRLLKEV